MASNLKPSASTADGQLSFHLQAPRLVKRPPAGVIVGGAYDGWAYVLIEHVAGGVRVKATPPAWPFPRDVVIKAPARLLAR